MQPATNRLARRTDRQVSVRRAARVAAAACLTLGALVRPAAAFEGDHYVWTFYLALHCGYTERQAFQVASATYAIDWDMETGPMGTWADWEDIAKGSPSQDLKDIWLRYHAFTETKFLSLGDDFIENAKNEHKTRLWTDLAVPERNPGPLLHYTQDYQAHFGWDTVHGHGAAGHRWRSLTARDWNASIQSSTGSPR